MPSKYELRPTTTGEKSDKIIKKHSKGRRCICSNSDDFIVEDFEYGWEMRCRVCGHLIIRRYLR